MSLPAAAMWAFPLIMLATILGVMTVGVPVSYLSAAVLAGAVIYHSLRAKWLLATGFYFTYAAADAATARAEADFIGELEQNPLWRSLGAVQNEQAFFVGGHWWRAQTYLLANRVLDDIFTHLTGAEAATPVLELP